MFHKGEGNCLVWLFYLKIFQWFTKKVYILTFIYILSNDTSHIGICHKYNLLLTNSVLLMEKIVKNSEKSKLTT